MSVRGSVNVRGAVSEEAVNVRVRGAVSVSV